MRGVERWVTTRSRRERLLLSAALLLAVFWSAVTMVWQPLQERRAMLLAQITGNVRALTLLSAQPPLLVAGSDDGRPIAVIIAETADEVGLTVRRLAPVSDGVDLTLEAAPFATLIPWLAQLETENRLLVARIELHRLTEPGQVAATLMLRR